MAIFVIEPRLFTPPPSSTSMNNIIYTHHIIIYTYFCLKVSSKENIYIFLKRDKYYRPNSLKLNIYFGGRNTNIGFEIFPQNSSEVEF